MRITNLSEWLRSNVEAERQKNSVFCPMHTDMMTEIATALEKMRDTLVSIHNLNEAYGNDPTKRTISLMVRETLEIKEQENG